MAGSRQRFLPWAGHGVGAFTCAFAIALVLCIAPSRAADKHAALLLDANSGRVLYQNSADEPRYPASLAKMMTLYLVFDLIEQRKLNYQTKIKMSEHAAGAAPSKLDLEPGQEIALIDAIKVLITKSANDVAIAVAEHIAGSEERFARLMTQKARQIGMAATTFRNASGLPDEEQKTTARDMATLALHLQDDFPTHYALFGTRTFLYNGETFRNHNSLLFHYEGTDGVKTGYTRASGFNLVSSVRRGRKHLIGVVFGGSTAASRNTTMRSLLNIGLVKGSPVKTRKPAPVAETPSGPNERKHAVAVRAAREQSSAPFQATMPAAIPRSVSPDAVGDRRIEIARVRPVLVGGNRLAEQASADAFPGPTTIEALIERSLRQEPANSPQPATSQIMLSGRIPTARETAMHLVADPQDRPELLSKPILVRGSPPSTFEAQAARLSSKPAASPESGPIKEPASALGIQIQIGAFQSAAEAERRIAWVRENAPAVVGTYPAETQPVKQGEKQFFRARFSGFDPSTAAQACKSLRVAKIDCLVVRSD